MDRMGDRQSRLSRRDVWCVSHWSYLSTVIHSTRNTVLRWLLYFTSQPVEQVHRPREEMVQCAARNGKGWEAGLQGVHLNGYGTC